MGNWTIFGSIAAVITQWLTPPPMVGIGNDPIPPHRTPVVCGAQKKAQSVNMFSLISF
jgi:hypothetical protein